MALTKVTGQVIKNTTDVTVGVLTVTNTLAVGGTVSIGGTLTYEDVTNVDAVGLITARNGIVVGSGITLSKDGDIFATGVTTTGSLVSSGAISGTTGNFSSNVDIGGDLTFDEVNARNLNITGIATIGFATAANAYVAGITTSSLLHVGMGATMVKVQGTPATRVGINSVGPAFTLDVDGDSNVTGTIRQGGTSVLTTASGDATALAIALG